MTICFVSRVHERPREDNHDLYYDNRTTHKHKHAHAHALTRARAQHPRAHTHARTHVLTRAHAPIKGLSI